MIMVNEVTKQERISNGCGHHNDPVDYFMIIRRPFNCIEIKTIAIQFKIKHIYGVNNDAIAVKKKVRTNGIIQGDLMR